MSRPIEWPSLRRFLLNVHTDLLIIHSKADQFIVDHDLTLAEQLILILEDRRFFRHFGVDLISVAREALRSLIRARHGGASTIDMQWVRTVTGYKDITYKRKLYEMFLALVIQQRYSKATIFRSYMDSAYLGTRIKGVSDASRKVFGKPLAALNLDEASEIAAMFVYPRPSLTTPRWRLKLERRKNYVKLLYPRYEQRFKKLPS